MLPGLVAAAAWDSCHHGTCSACCSAAAARTFAAREHQQSYLVEAAAQSCLESRMARPGKLVAAAA